MSKGPLATNSKKELGGERGSRAQTREAGRPDPCCPLPPPIHLPQILAPQGRAALESRQEGAAWPTSISGCCHFRTPWTNFQHPSPRGQHPMYISINTITGHRLPRSPWVTPNTYTAALCLNAKDSAITLPNTLRSSPGQASALPPTPRHSISPLSPRQRSPGGAGRGGVFPETENLSSS